MDKAKSRRKENNEEAFVFPYDVGCRVNFTEVMKCSSVLRYTDTFQPNLV